MDIEKILSELTLEEKAGLCSGRDFWHTKAVSRLGIPSVMMCDGPHGLRKQKGEGDHLGINESIETVCYPTASALAASFDRSVCSVLGDALGRECQAEDVGMLLGPGVNMKRSPLCGRNFEYFSEDPYLAGELASSYVKGLQAQGISACVKHFACNNQETRRMSGSSEVDERTLHEIYLPAFEAVVKKGGTRSIMNAYNGINGTFCAENKNLLTDILRKDWGFHGMVVTDWGAVKDRVKGLLAGVDLEMPGGPGTQDAAIVEAVKNGTLEEAVVDEAVRNVLQFVSDTLSARRPEETINRAACAELSESLALQCAVLLKNDGALPLAGSSKTVLIGEFAEHPRYQGAGSSHINTMQVKDALHAAKDAGLQPGYALGYRSHEEKTDPVLLAEAVSAAAAAKTAVIFAGLPDAWETEGCDRDSLALPENQNELIAAVAKVQPNTVVVLQGGAPMELPWIDQVSAVLCMYLAGQQSGEAAVKLLTGEADPSGRLAETWPLKLEDNPSFLNFPGEDGIVPYREGIYIGYRYYDRKKMPVLFPFGHGLSYTTFAYGDLKLDRTELADTDTLTVTCRVKNTGTRAGKEVVQLYVRDCESSVGRPVRELKGFEKVALQPGEEKTVTFVLDRRSWAYYEPKVHDWFVESGRFAVEIGSSSRDIRLSGEVNVTSADRIPIHYTSNSTIGDLFKTDKGRGLMQKLMPQGQAGTAEKASDESAKAMGEGSARMAQAMMMEMPLCALITFGRMTKPQLDGILQMLNS